MQWATKVQAGNSDDRPRALVIVFSDYSSRANSDGKHTTRSLSSLHSLLDVSHCSHIVAWCDRKESINGSGGDCTLERARMEKQRGRSIEKSGSSISCRYACAWPALRAYAQLQTMLPGGVDSSRGAENPMLYSLVGLLSYTAPPFRKSQHSQGYMMLHTASLLPGTEA